MGRNKAFTLIELLVVIAIIAILAAILFPVFAQAKEAAKKTTAISNAKQIALGVTLYASDSDDVIMPSCTADYTVNRTPQAYVWRSSMMLMQPYLKNYDIWTNPADSHSQFAGSDGDMWDGALISRKRPLSFNYMSNINTVQSESVGMDRNTGIGPFVWDIGYEPTRSLTSFDEPSSTIAFAEMWTDGRVGGYWGSTAIMCDTWKLAGRVPLSGAPADRLPAGNDNCDRLTRDPTAIPTKGYAGGRAVYSFVDGSAKALGWGQVRKNDFYLFKVAKPATVYNP